MASMAAEKAVATSSSDGGFWAELFHTNVYKPTQGLMTRRLTCLAIWATGVICSYKLLAGNLLAVQMESMLKSMGSANVDKMAVTLAYSVAGLLLAAVVWVGYRLVNWPPFADFLVNVEGEMNKVTWPTWDELKAASWVVIFTMLSLALLIFSIDVVWKAVLDTLGYLITMLAGKA
jgi:preprotein translocase subunit SecE